MKKNTIKKKELKNVGRTKFSGISYPLRDATASMIYEVTKDDLTNAKREDPNQCALACAIRRTFGSVRVRRTVAHILRLDGINPCVYRYKLSSGAQKAIATFDNGGEFPEGTYKLFPYCPSQTLDAKRGQKHDRKSKNINKRRPSIMHTLRGQIEGII